MDIVPSFLDSNIDPQTHSDGGALSNIKLRLGEVQEIIYSNDLRNLSKKFIEYKVLVQHQSNGTGVAKMYDHCVLINTLGSLADFCTWTLRTDKSASVEATKKITVGKGSKVVLLCINGDSNNALILGGIRDAADLSEQGGKDVERGHNFRFVFNGMNASINKDGELAITYGGKTELDGKTNVDDKFTGTRVLFKKNGNLEIANGERNNSIVVDNERSRVSIKADERCEVDVNGRTFIRSAGVSTGTATDATMLGTTYRDAEHEMNQGVLAYMAAMGSTANEASSAFSSASIAIGLSEFGTASAALGAAAGSMSTLGDQFKAVHDIIQRFEKKADQYLSKKNKSD